MTWRLARRDIWWLAATTLLALALRLAWMSYATGDPTDGRFNDSVFYHLVGANLAEGGSYTSPYTLLPTAHFAPGYPYFLAGLYRVFGDSVTVAEVANAVLGAATVGVLYLLAYRLFDSRTARIAAVMLAVFPGQVLYASVLFSEPLFTFALMLALVLMVAARDRAASGGWFWLVAFGAAVGAAALIRPTGLALFVVAPVYWAASTRDWGALLRWSAVAGVTAALVLVPWTVRNYRAMDTFVVVTSSTGLNIWTGHHEGANGGDDVPLNSPLEKYGPRTREGGEVDISNAGYRLAWRFARENPDEEVLLIGKRFRALYLDGDAIGLDLNEWWGERPTIASGLKAILRPLSNAYYYAVLAISALALVRWRVERGDGPLLPLLTIAVFTLGHVVLFFGSSRYHFPLVPLFCLLAAWALAGLPVVASEAYRAGWPFQRSSASSARA
jgi:4-amino-4-deoxy-L-arabinose transferase-like glycosyltransferase